MERFRYENQEEGQVILYTMEAAERIDTLSMGMIREQRPGYIMPAIFYADAKGQRIIKFITYNSPSLIQFLINGISRDRLLDLTIQIIDKMQDAEEFMFMPEYFQLRPEHIVMDAEGDNLRLLYLPCLGSECTTDVKDLIRVMLEKANITDIQSGVWKNRIMQILDETDSLDRLKDGIREVRNDSGSDNVTPIPVPQSFPVTQTPPVSPIPVPEFASSPVEYIPKAGETSVLSKGMPEAQTQVLTSDNNVYAHLMRVKTQERINIGKNEFHIGKEMGNDYVVYDNPTVSRRHAIICLQDGQYYIRDTNSKNHTYINGSVINSMENVLIRHGDYVRLSNEEFIFCMS